MWHFTTIIVVATMFEYLSKSSNTLTSVIAFWRQIVFCKSTQETH